MVNTVRKGNRNQNKARKQLEAEGWQVEVARRGFKGTSIDFFGLWDIIAYRAGYFLYIQVKTNYCPPGKQQPLKDWLTDGVFVKRQLWVYRDYHRGGPDITDLHGEPREEDEERREDDLFSNGA